MVGLTLALLAASASGAVINPAPWIRALPAVTLPAGIDKGELDRGVRVRVSVDGEGHAIACEKYRESRSEEIVALACGRMMGATFEPMHASAGTPLASEWIGWVSLKQVAAEPLINAPTGEPMRVGPPMGEWQQTNDYPIRALRKRKEGTTRFRALVGGSGRVVACQIARSAGDDDLDTAACARITRWAAFNPATDDKGQPAGGYFEQFVGWKLAE